MESSIFYCSPLYILLFRTRSAQTAATILLLDTLPFPHHHQAMGPTQQPSEEKSTKKACGSEDSTNRDLIKASTSKSSSSQPKSEKKKPTSSNGSSSSSSSGAQKGQMKREKIEIPARTAGGDRGGNGNGSGSEGKGKEGGLEDEMPSPSTADSWRCFQQ